MAKTTQTTLYIDLNALEHNYRFLRSQISGDTKFLGVVKAYAYGSDSVAIAKKLESLGADYLAVAYADEGVALRENRVKCPILVLHPLPANFDAIIENQLEPNLYSELVLDGFIKRAAEKGLERYPVHLKIDTGLNRLGFKDYDVDGILGPLTSSTHLSVKSVFSHLSASEDDAEKDFSLSQIAKYKGLFEKLGQGLGYFPLRHMVNTSGLLNYAEAHFDMVRSGIGLYGFGNDPKHSSQLKPVFSLKSLISQIHDISVGESIGYNRGFMAKNNMRSATLPIGHADGIHRSWGQGKASVLIYGQKAPILGNVCMDMIMVDVTHIKDCREGDEVTIIGPGQEANDLAEEVGTISYEVMTSISQRVKRIVIDTNDD